MRRKLPNASKGIVTNPKTSTHLYAHDASNPHDDPCSGNNCN